MRYRRQPPAHSPISARALFAGLQVAITGNARAHSEVRETLRKRLDAEEVFLVDSGTSALALAMRAACVIGNEPVAIPAFGCYDLATAAAAADVEVMLYDVDPLSLAPRRSSLTEVLRAGAGAILIAPLYGVPVDMVTPLYLANQAEVPVIEDAAQSIGSSWRDRPLGSLGDFSIFSFGRGKGLTGGGGGALVYSSSSSVEAVAAQAHSGKIRRGWKELAQTATQWLFSHPRLYSLPASLPFLRLGETIYREPTPTTSMSGACAGIVAENLSSVDLESRRRRENAERLMEVVDAIVGLERIRPPADSTPGWLRFPVLMQSSQQVELISGEIGKRLGIGTGYPRPLSNLRQLLPRCRNSGGRFPGAEALAERLITLPTHSKVSPEDIYCIDNHLRSSVTGS